MLLRRRLPLLLVLVATAYTTTALAVDYQAKPVISAIAPQSGPPGTVVTLSGRNFNDAHKVYFNGVELKVTERSTTSLVVKLPAEAVQGRFQLKGPRYEITSPQVFWVAASTQSPAISKIAPVNGPPGTVITISGRNFSAKSHENTVMVGDVALLVKSASQNKIRAVVPEGAKSGNITVKVYGNEQTTSSQSFAVLAKHQVAGFEPNAGLPGTHVIIKGLGLPATKSDLKITLAGQTCPVISQSPTEIIVAVPENDASSAPFDVWVKGLGSVLTKKQFEVLYPPRISEFLPAAGKAGAVVTLRGERFGDSAEEVTVLLTGRQCEIKSFKSTEISLLVPEGAVSGTFKVVNERMGAAESGTSFDVWAPLAVTRVEPLYGLPGTEVKMWGTGFRIKPSDHTVYVGDLQVAVKNVGQGVIAFDMPTEVPDGRVTLRLEVKDRGATELPMPFLALHTPEISGFTPKRGPIGTSVTVTGRYFGKKVNHVRIRLGDTIVPAATVSPSSISFTVPEGADTGQIRVETVRRGADEAKGDFEVYQPVKIIGFLPTKGYPGQTVHLFGNGFEKIKANNTVTLGGKPVRVVEASPSRLKIKLDKTASSGSFRVKVPARGASESGAKFTIINPVKIASFKPAKGVPGTYVQVKGLGFDNSNLRAYIGDASMGVRVDSPTTATVAIPADAEKGALVFRAPGAGRAESKATFNVLTPLTIAAFDPIEGEAGSEVTIYGTGFDLAPKKTTIFFGDKELKAGKGSTDNTLVVTIPKDAKEGATFKIAVVDRGETVAPAPFNIVVPRVEPVGGPDTGVAPPSGVEDLLGAPEKKKEVAKIDSFEPSVGGVGDVVTITGAGFGEDPTAVQVWIGQAPALVVGVVPDMIMVEVPDGVRSGKLRVKIGNKPMIVAKEQFVVQQ